MANTEYPILRIGLTMRVDQAAGYAEPRDALAQDWAPFLAAVLPEVLWVPVPNLGRAAVDYAAALGLGGFLLTGGNDIGACPRRDETESALLAHALAHDLPVFGVCRGLQMIQTYFGGPLHPCDRDRHVARHHTILTKIITVKPGKDTEEWSDARTVNSYHAHSVRRPELAPALEAIAITEDGLVEGLRHRTARVTAVQWHPERCPEIATADRMLIRRTFLSAE